MRNLILFMLIFCCLTINAQVIVKNYSTSQVGKKGLFGKQHTVSEIRVTCDVQISKSTNRVVNGLPKVAEVQEIKFNPLKGATKETIGEYTVYRKKIIATDAATITVFFDTLRLSSNAQLYIYNPEGTQVIGPITAKENTKKHRWGSSSFFGNAVILELKVPSIEVGNNFLTIGKILFGLPSVPQRIDSDSTMLGNFNSSSACNQNVICAGSTWENERKAVCYIERGDGAPASGALVMNTCNLNIPYVLTANHVTSGTNVGDYRFLFGWWSSTCSTNTNTTQSLLFNGSTLVATHANTDFSLLLLDQIPDPSLNMSYLGWSRSTTAPTTSVIMGHPSGDQLKIAYENDQAVVGNVGVHLNTAWRVRLDLGTVQKGSSGGPMFDQNRRLVGQLFSNTQPETPPCNQASGGSNSGRFDLSWTGGGTNSTRLSNWLDPSGSNANSTNTVSVADMVTPSTFQISGANNICSTGNLTLNVPGSVSVTWESSNNSIAMVEGSGGSATVTRLADGVVTITATFTYCGSTYVVTREIIIGVPIIGYVSFVTPSQNEGYWCSNAYGNTFYTSPILTGVTYEASLYSWPSMTLIQTAVNPSPGSDPFGYISAGWYVVKIRATNACGSSNWYETEVEYVDCSSFRMTQNFAITVSPNPSSTDFNIMIDKETPSVSKLSKNEKVKVSLFEKDGASQVKAWEFDNTKNQYKLDIRGMKAGSYVLIVQKGGYKEAKQVIIK